MATYCNTFQTADLCHPFSYLYLFCNYPFFFATFAFFLALNFGWVVPVPTVVITFIATGSGSTTSSPGILPARHFSCGWQRWGYGQVSQVTMPYNSNNVPKTYPSPCRSYASHEKIFDGLAGPFLLTYSGRQSEPASLDHPFSLKPRFSLSCPVCASACYSR
jgi:hypothetical protein